MEALLIDRPAPAGCGYPPPRLGDLMHVVVPDGPVHSAVVQSVADDGATLTVTGPLEPARRRDLVVEFRRVGAPSTGGEA